MTFNGGAVQKVAVLTTPTVPHRWFLSQLGRRQQVWAFFEEEPADPPGYEFAFPLERAEHEWPLSNMPCTYGASFYGKRLDEAAVEDIKAERPDVIFVLGTLKLPEQFLDIAPIYNFHSSHPAHYRGLNNDFWVCYLKDWEFLGVACHEVEPTLDTGAMVGWARLPSRPCPRLWMLRTLKMEAALRLAEMISTGAASPPHIAYTPGRYFGAMPTMLQRVADRNLEMRKV